MKELDIFINNLLEEWKVPGLAIAIIQDESVIFSQGFGLRDKENGLEVTTATLFAIGSCTKAFTTTAMGILVDEGKLDWDKPVRDYLPDFRMHDPYVTENMTPRDLVTHRSGLPRHDLVWYGSSATRKELFGRLRHLEPSKGFRSEWQYQNLMYMTAGYLVGQISGGTWEEFTQKHILDPLGMSNTNFSVMESQKAPDFALPYNELSDGIGKVPFRNIDAVGPAGSINSNVEDMANWILLNLRKGKWNEEQVVSEASLNQIYMPQMVIKEPIKYAEMLQSSYAMGWVVLPYRGNQILSHGGGIDGFSALVSLIPGKNAGVVILTNLGGTPIPSIIALNIYDRLLELDEVPWNERTKEQVAEGKKKAEEEKKKADEDRKDGTQPSHPLEEYTGDFQHPAYGTFSVEKEGEHLKISYRSVSSPLEHYHYDTFKATMDSIFPNGMKFTFSTDIQGNISSLSAPLEAPVKDIVFTRLKKEG